MTLLAPDAIWYDWSGLNSALFLFINGLEWPAIDAVMLGFTAISHPAIYPVAIAAALLWKQAREHSFPTSNLTVFAVSYIIASTTIVPAIKDFLDFPRPASVFGQLSIRVLGTPDPAQAFPSGHATFATLIAASLAPGASRMARLVLFSYALLACLSRIWVGAHFPADVLGGVLIALVTVTLSRAALQRTLR